MIRFVGASMTFKSGLEPVPALRNVNLTVDRGEILTILGPSGCGKSTTLNMVAGLCTPTSGQVYYDGALVDGYNTRVGYMTQQDHLLPWRTTAANVALPLELQKATRTVRKIEVDRLLALTGLSGFGDHYPHHLSGGMRRRCALARLLAYDPETLLMDEPFAALDAQMRLDLQGELRKIAYGTGKTVVFITHDIDEAVLLGDRCAVFAGAPGSIIDVLNIPFAADRDLAQMRFDDTYRATTEHLWRLMSRSEGAGVLNPS